MNLNESLVIFSPQKQAPDLSRLSPDNTCLFKMAKETGGAGKMNFMFKSYHMKCRGSVSFLGFQDSANKWNPVAIPGYTSNGQDDSNRHNFTIFTLFRVVQFHLL